MSRQIIAFDYDRIHAGNKGLYIDHAAITERVDKLLSSMTLAQKINQIRGLQNETIEGLYYSGEDQDLNIEPFKMVDGPRGARTGKATAFPVAIARAATFDADLERRVGMAIGKEVLARGGNVLLAPTINLLRHPGWGRAQETYSEDTFHTGVMGVAFVSGAQNFVLTSPKHFAVNNVEITRFDMSAEISPRVLHEIYLPHFKRCVVEGAAASVMSAYNKVNGTYCGENEALLTKILRDDWGFKGFVESDWFLGARSTAPSLNAGMDIEMPSGFRFSDEKIMAAIDNKELTEETITQAAGRVLHQKLAWDLKKMASSAPGADVIECADHLSLAREVAEKSIVLLKNQDQILPLTDTPTLRIAIIGNLANTINLGDRGSSMVTPTETITPLAGIQASIKHCSVDFLEDDYTRLGEYDLCIVIAGFTYREEGEFIPNQQIDGGNEGLARGGDRQNLTLPDPQLTLINVAIAEAQKTIVILEGGSAIEVRDWVDDVDALMLAWYPGCRGGEAIANVLFGAVNPAGKLPVTFPRSLDQLPPFDMESLSVEHEFLQGYRYYSDEKKRGVSSQPEFPFGFGLSYTRFTLDCMYLRRFDDGFQITVDIMNIGDVAGATVPQIYLSHSDSAILRASRTLKGFGRIHLAPGESASMVYEIMDESLMYYDESTLSWQMEPCEYTFSCGFDSGKMLLDASWRFEDQNYQDKLLEGKAKDADSDEHSGWQPV
ncbi:MAG: beta-glucosidase [Litorivivens sp.]|jgi:beta-glucosidase